MAVTTPSPPPPDRVHCAHGADEADPVGCRGTRTPGHGACPAHLSPAELHAYVHGLPYGASVDWRGVPFTQELVTTLFAPDGLVQALELARIDLREARFVEDVTFAGCGFAGEVVFEGARFDGEAVFESAVFRAGAWFTGARFQGIADFGGGVFEGDAGFGRTVFAGNAWFGGVRFGGRAWFQDARFERDASFTRAVFAGAWTGPLTCARELSLAEAAFEGPLHLTLSATRLDAARASFGGTSSLRVRGATVNLAQAHLTHPCSLATDRSGPGHARDETVAVTSLRGVDAALLLLSDVDLRRCAFSGAHHLDQLHLEGRWDLGSAPQGVRWHRGVPWRCTKRLVIEEERQWRAMARATGRRRARHDWGAPPEDPRSVPGLATLTSTYRQLRKAREDAKDEPGAADFYYGEMEMRRYSRSWRHGERWILQAYWALSGYGLRASRSLLALAAAMLVTVLLMMAYGLPDTPARALPTHAHAIGAGAPTLHASYADRFTGARAEKAGDVVLNSVIFRSSGQHLTRPGGCIEKAARFTEPVLIGLAALAVRGRVKRG